MSAGGASVRVPVSGLGSDSTLSASSVKETITRRALSTSSEVTT